LLIGQGGELAAWAMQLQRSGWRRLQAIAVNGGADGTINLDFEAFALLLRSHSAGPFRRTAGGRNIARPQGNLRVEF
jgi:hypothetical protein